MNREDIDVTRIRITDTFRYGEQTFQGLEDLMKHSRHNGNVQGTPPYVVRKTESYPCFDSSDFMYENRFYQSYFLTMNKEKAAYIYEESGMSSWDFREKHIEEQYPVMEPMFNMGRIEERHLPFVYYHGDGEWMEIVQDRNAGIKVEVLSKPWFHREIDDPFACLYGPPPIKSSHRFYVEDDDPDETNI